MEGSRQEAPDCAKLKEIQDKFCEAAGVYAFCVDSDGTDVTEMSGNDRDKAVLERLVPREKLMALFHRVAESRLEDQAIEDTEIDALKYAAVCIKKNAVPVLTWFVYGVMSDAPSPEGQEFAGDFRYRTTEKQFNLTLDIFYETSMYLADSRAQAQDAQQESLRSRYSQEETENVLRRTAATTGIVQMLDSDAPVEEIMADILSTIGGLLQIGCAYMCSMESAGSQRMDVIAQWCADGVPSVFDQTKDQPRPAFLFGEKPLVLSSGAGSGELSEGRRRMGIEALAAFPISLRDRVTMYAFFAETREKRSWKVEEVKFLSDSVKVVQSILTKRIQKNSLASSYAALEEVLNNIGSSVYVRDLQSGGILFANRWLRNDLRYEMEHGGLAELFESGIPQDSREGSMELRLEERGNWYDFLYKTLTWVDGREVRLCCAYDITEKKMYQRRLEHQAYTDFLTGLYNRLCCERDLAKYVDVARQTGQEGAVLYLDMDDFKHINDTLGHQYGDVLLKSIAQGMRGVRGIANSCYRMGGDEFIIIVPPGQYGILGEIVEGIRAVFNRPWFLKDADYYCTMSMGIVKFPAEGEGVEELIRKADIAMYDAKKSGKNRVAWYDHDVRDASGRRLDMEKNMREAAQDGYREFEVYYQPIVDIQENNRCVGAEALIRWNSEEMGFVSPVDFIPLAEYLGLINPIGYHVLQQACETCKRWNDSGKPDYKVNVNLSVVQLLQPDIVEQVGKIIRDSGINPHNLTLEVTEGLAINDLDRMKQILGDIKALGARIALDDFGTGYSSLSHIRELPFDVIKVDQSFVKDLAEDDYSRSFIRMVSDLADAIGVSICVEGIETKEQYKVLEGMKVRMIQGFYFDRPMPEREFAEKYVG